MAVTERRPAIYTGSRIPHPIPTVLQTDPALEDVLTVNFGPNHPSTHGVLRLIVDLHGEHIVGLSAVIGGIFPSGGSKIRDVRRLLDNIVWLRSSANWLKS